MIYRCHTTTGVSPMATENRKEACPKESKGRKIVTQQLTPQLGNLVREDYSN